MTRRKIGENNKFATSLAPASYTAGTANGTAVDTLGYNGAELAISFGATAVGSVKLQTSDTSGGTYVDLGDSVTVTTVANGGKTAFISVPELNLGDAKRYLRAVLVATGTTVASAVIILTRPNEAPVTQ